MVIRSWVPVPPLPYHTNSPLQGSSQLKQSWDNLGGNGWSKARELRGPAYGHDFQVLPISSLRPLSTLCTTHMVRKFMGSPTTPPHYPPMFPLVI